MNSTPVLGIETSGTSTGLALAVGGRAVAELVEHSACGHNEVLMPLLDRLLKESGVKASSLAGIGVDVGPGMFTSLRVGTSTAKGFAIAHRIPVVGIGSLWGLARTAVPALSEVLAVIDARKHQVYAALYLKGEQAVAPVVVDPGQLATRIGTAVPLVSRLVVAGNGAGLCADRLAAAGIVLESSGIETPSPGVVALEAERRITLGLVDDLAAVEPLYLRRTDAELTRETKAAPGS